MNKFKDPDEMSLKNSNKVWLLKARAKYTLQRQSVISGCEGEQGGPHIGQSSNELMISKSSEHSYQGTLKNDFNSVQTGNVSFCTKLIGWAPWISRV